MFKFLKKKIKLHFPIIIYPYLNVGILIKIDHSYELFIANSGSSSPPHTIVYSDVTFIVTAPASSTRKVKEKKTRQNAESFWEKENRFGVQGF